MAKNTNPKRTISTQLIKKYFPTTKIETFVHNTLQVLIKILGVPVQIAFTYYQGEEDWEGNPLRPNEPNMDIMILDTNANYGQVKKILFTQLPPIESVTLPETDTWVLSYLINTPNEMEKFFSKIAEIATNNP